MRDEPTTHLLEITADPCTSLPCPSSFPASLLPRPPASFHRSLTVSLLPFFHDLTAKTVFAWTSVTGGPPQAPTSPSVSQQNAPARPPLANTRLPRAQSKGRTPTTARRSQVTSHGTRVTPHLIYGTGIKKLRKPTPINEYKLLIYGKPPCSTITFNLLSLKGPATNV